jgi:predicted CopG family antitoxin
MRTVNVRIPEELRDMLKIIATLEKRDMKDILSELVEEYIERHKETLEILSNPKWVEMIKQGKREVEEGMKGKSLNELED